MCLKQFVSVIKLLFYFGASLSLRTGHGVWNGLWPRPPGTYTSAHVRLGDVPGYYQTSLTGLDYRENDIFASFNHGSFKLHENAGLRWSKTKQFRAMGLSRCTFSQR